MNYDNYPSAFIADDLSVFEFISKGKRGEIRKRIVFMRTSMNGVYNLAFGRVTEENGLDDLSITDNGDRNKILATVVRAVDVYTRRYPTRSVYFMGSSEQRTRLYRMAVGVNLEELSLNFEIYADTDEDEEFVPFHKNMKIKAFLIKRRLTNNLKIE